MNNKETSFRRRKKDGLELIADAIENLACAIREPRTHDIINIIVSQSAPTKPRVRFEFGIGQPQNKQKEGHVPVRVTVTNEQKVKVTLNPVTDTGKPAKLDPKSPPTWEVITGDATVQVDEGGNSATLISGDDPGDTQFMVRADADIGDGVEEISDIVTLNVVGATAKNLGITVGSPEPKA